MAWRLLAFLRPRHKWSERDVLLKRDTEISKELPVAEDAKVLLDWNQSGFLNIQLTLGSNVAKRKGNQHDPTRRTKH
jgi:hypothetical protein